jgi:hypothetical protein
MIFEVDVVCHWNYFWRTETNHNNAVVSEIFILFKIKTTCGMLSSFAA